MQAVFVDCTPELRRVMAEHGLAVPEGLAIHDGSPDLSALVGLCRGADTIAAEHTVVIPPARAAGGVAGPRLRARR